MAPNDGHPKVNWPTDPSKAYIRMGFCEWFYGPFNDTTAALNFARDRQAENYYWGYDGFAVCTIPTEGASSLSDLRHIASEDYAHHGVNH